MYFPKKTRRTKYKTTKAGSYYADYKSYFDEIAEDCQHRCVYCDVLMKEVGGESMHLDHFKPQKYFPELGSDPTNLVLACPRCNQLKSDWWPEKTGTAEGGRNGFVDPFTDNLAVYFSVDSNGKVVAGNPPSQYVIDLLAINRPTRTAIRRARAITDRALKLLARVEFELDELAEKPHEEIRERLPALSAAMKQIREMLTEVLR